MIERLPIGEDRVTLTWRRVVGALEYRVMVRRFDRSEEYAVVRALQDSHCGNVSPSV